MRTVLTIAGSDSSGGAGIQADLKTMCAYGVYGMSAITALTAQNTTGVSGIQECGAKMLEQQLDCVFTDIFPDAVKIGMVFKAELAHVIAGKLALYGAKNVVLDPVMVSTSGSALIEEDTKEVLAKTLFRMADVITPNIPEAEWLLNREIRTKEAMEEAAAALAERFCVRAVLLKGGHCVEDASDVLWKQEGIRWFCGRRIDNPNTHGTGCTLSSAIACGLAAGLSLEESIQSAKAYVAGALAAGLNLGKGSGPLHHGWQK